MYIVLREGTQQETKVSANAAGSLAISKPSESGWDAAMIRVGGISRDEMMRLAGMIQEVAEQLPWEE
jgi:hypothetical protein